MNEEDLLAFGQQLKQLRKVDGYTQEQLAEKLMDLHTRSDSDNDLRLDGNRISKWERAYVDKKGRIYKPKRHHVLYFIEIFVAQLTPEMVRVWVAKAGYAFGWHELKPIFAKAMSTTLSPNGDRPPLVQMGRLFGVTKKLNQLQTRLDQPTDPWLLAICGIGGIGKTTLTEALLKKVASTGYFQATAWVSAKQKHFLPYSGMKEIDQPALNDETLVNTLLEQLSERPVLTVPLSVKITHLAELVKQTPTLIVVDNLETAVDYESLLPLLRRLSNPSKVLLTSRVQLRDYDVYSVPLDELTKADTFEFLRYEGYARGLEFLVEAAPEHLQSIYQTVGGNPLALKLVVGQLAALPLGQVLDSLREAPDKQAEDFYTYIYWQAWKSLDEASQKTLLVMPLLAHGGTFEHLLAVSKLAVELLRSALAELVKRSLVEVRGDIAERRYTIHRLTETFLLNEVIKW